MGKWETIDVFKNPSNGKITLNSPAVDALVT